MHTQLIIQWGLKLNFIDEVCLLQEPYYINVGCHETKPSTSLEQY